MELLDGLDLARLVERAGPLPVADACELARQAALGLHHAHGRGLVHRDVKPSNLFLTRDGVVKVLDLGLARNGSPAASEASLTGSGQLLGTLDYMAPEQAFDTHAADARSDAYGLGCTLYKLLTGHPPFGGPEYRPPLRKALAHAQRPVPPLAERRPDVTPELAAVVGRLLAKDPGERFASLADVAEALRPFAAGADPAAPAARHGTPPDLAPEDSPDPDTVGPPASARPGLPASRRPAWLIAVGLVGVALVGGAGVLAWVGSRPSHGDGPPAPPESAAPAASPTRRAAVPERGAVVAPVPGTGRWQPIPNGGFEEPDPDGRPPGWPPQVPPDNRGLGLFRRSAARAYRGAAGAEAVPAREFARTGFAHITDYLPVERGRRYVLSGFFDTGMLSGGELRLDLAQVSFDVLVEARPGVPGWQFVWGSFTPELDRVRVRLVRGGHVKPGEPGFIDEVGLTPADEFVPPDSPGQTR